MTKIEILINKRNRYNMLLEALREPKTVQQLEKQLGARPNNYTEAVRVLMKAGYVKKVGRSTEKMKAAIWQAVKFDYRDEGVDYTAPVKPEAEVITTLADAVYIHNSDRLKEKYKATSELLMRERKSPRVWVSGAQSYA